MAHRYLLFSFVGMTEHPSPPNPKPFSSKTYLYDCSGRHWQKRAMSVIARRTPIWAPIPASEVPALYRTQALLNS